MTGVPAGGVSGPVKRRPAAAWRVSTPLGPARARSGHGHTEGPRKRRAGRLPAPQAAAGPAACLSPGAVAPAAVPPKPWRACSLQRPSPAPGRSIACHEPAMTDEGPPPAWARRPESVQVMWPSAAGVTPGKAVVPSPCRLSHVESSPSLRPLHIETKVSARGAAPPTVSAARGLPVSLRPPPRPPWRASGLAPGRPRWSRGQHLLLRVPRGAWPVPCS